MKRVISLTSISMFILFVLITHTVHAVTVSEVKGGSPESRTITTITALNDNDIVAYAAYGWTFQTAIASPSSYKDASCIMGTVAGTFTRSEGIFNFVNFTVSMSGRITASGSGPGLDNYSISATRLFTSYWIVAADDKTVIPLGDAVTYHAFETMSNFLIGSKNSDWEYASSGNSPQSADSGTSFTTPTTLTAGDYTITGSPVMWAEAISDSENLKVVEVASLLATYGTAPNATTASSGTNDPKISETLIIPKGKSATIVATPNPDVWPTYMAGDPPTAHSYPTWSVTGVSNPSTILTSLNGPNTSIKSTVGSGTYTIVASCGTSTKAIKITVIQITHNSTDVTEGSGTSKTMIVGEPNNLVVSGATFSSVSWSVPGIHIKSWTVNYDSSTTQDLEASDLDNTSLTTYYWYKSGTNLIPSVTVTIGTQQTGTKSTTIATKPFTVTKPSITVTTTTNTVALDQNYISFPITYLHLGKPSSSNDPPVTDGIKLSYSTVTGLTQWVQLVKGRRRRQRSSDNKWETTPAPPGLDGAYPYSGLSYAKDSPAVRLYSTLSKVIVNDSYDMYLMFKSITSGSIYVPIKVTSWGWKGTATKNGTTWTLSDVTNPTPSTSDTSSYPTWDESIDPNDWQLEQ